MPQIFQQFDRGNAALDPASDTVAITAFRQVLAEPHRDLGLDAQAAIIPNRQFGAAVMHLAGEDRAETRLVDTAQLLHDRRRQTDLVAGDGTAPARHFDLLENGADRIGVVEVARHQLGRQDVGLPPLAEQRGDALCLLLNIEFQRLHLQFHHRDTENTENRSIVVPARTGTHSSAA
jgi:hypothetical protein